MTKLGLIGDIHDHRGRLQRVLKWLGRQQPLDAVLLVGDIAGNPSWERRTHPEELMRMRLDIERIVREVSRSLDAPVLFVPGNHDPADIRMSGNIDRRSRTVNGINVVGIGGAGPDLFGLPYEWTESEIDEITLPRWDLLLSHCPPRDTDLDRLRQTTRHVGSAAIRRRAEAGAGLLVCGHIHESVSAQVLGQTLCVNIGGLGEPHGAAQAAVARVDLAGPSLRVDVHHRNIELGADQFWHHETSRLR